MTLLGEARNYDELVALFRRRCVELGTSMETLDLIAGTPSRYVSKLLCSMPIKHLGPISMGLMLGALALKLQIMVDHEQEEKIKDRLIPKASSPAFRRQHNIGNVRRELVGNSSWGHAMRIRQVQIQLPRKRQKIARNAATVRWSKSRVGR